MTELELQRIVDGEMTGAERARCLTQLDEQSPHWRSLALSLLADQDLRRCFQPVEPDVMRSTVATVSHGRTPYPAHWPLALAASLLAIVVGGAWWLRGQPSNSPAEPLDRMAATEANRWSLRSRSHQPSISRFNPHS